MAARSAKRLFGVLVGYAKPIFALVLEIARAPYTALLDVQLSGEDFTFAGLEEVISNGLVTIASTITVIAPLLLLILLISVGWNYFKLLLETVERYIVVGVLCYTSPLAFAMAAQGHKPDICKLVPHGRLAAPAARAQRLVPAGVQFLRGPVHSQRRRAHQRPGLDLPLVLLCPRLSQNRTAL